MPHSYLHVCRDCHTVESFRREHPGLVAPVRARLAPAKVVHAEVEGVASRAGGVGGGVMSQEIACSICRRVSLWREGLSAHFVHEFEHSVLVVGDHQFHRGYCLLLLKEHVRELHELEPAVFLALSRELIAAGRAVVETFGPWKMNYSCYGNVDPHIHWHLFPRYDTEPDHLNHPWLHASEFKDHLIDEETARGLAARIRARLAA